MVRVGSKPPFAEFAAAPLVPIAVAVTVGLVVGHLALLTPNSQYALAAAGAIGWAVGRRRQTDFAYVCLLGGLAGVSAVHLHQHRTHFPADDIANQLGTTPGVVRLRGVLDEPFVIKPGRRTVQDGAVPIPDRAVTRCFVDQVRTEDGGWEPASGVVRVTVELLPGTASEWSGRWAVGDAVEAVGQWSVPVSPGNPGEWDYAAQMVDDRIRGELLVNRSADGLVRLSTDGRPSAVLARLREHLAGTLTAALSGRSAALARTLLLGESHALDRTEWDAFVRTGVVHVLAISGQHLVILAGMVWWMTRFGGLPRRSAAAIVLGLIVGYTVLTGCRPSAVRACVMVVVSCSGVLLRRPVRPANTFALAWLIIIGRDPTDIFTLGCQLSFISVFMLVWGVGRWASEAPEDPLDALERRSRSVSENALRAVAAAVGWAFVVSVALFLTNLPLLMFRQNLVSPIGCLLGPPVIVLTTIALVAGLGLLVIGSVVSLPPLAWVVQQSLCATDDLVHWADRLPFGVTFVSTPSWWWVAGFYLILAVAVLSADRRGWAGLLIWCCLGLIGSPRQSSDELRVTVLSVGHGGCTVIEPPDGRVILYDIGTLTGPDVVRRVVAPFLWHRGHTRIDELLISHADLDHFNGLRQLLDRFPVGRVTVTPSFASKPIAEVAEVLLALESRGVTVQVAVAGDRLSAGAVEFDVLHPPADGLAGTENERSLVARLTYLGRTILLTGDLEKAGTARVLALPQEPCDVLTAPHHGSRSGVSPEFFRWCRPKYVAVSCGPRMGLRAEECPAPIRDTHTHGALTIRVNPTGMTVETFRTGERMVLLR